MEIRDPARRGDEGPGVLGVDATFDRRAQHAHLVLGDRQRRAGRNLDLLVDDVDAGDHLGDRMLDLDARVHLDEVEPPALVQELDRSRADIAELRHGAGDDGADLLALTRIERGGRSFLPDLLVTPLQRAVALAEMNGPALSVAEHLDLDVARPAEILLQIDSVVAEGRLGFEPRIAERVHAARPDRSRPSCRGRRRPPPP